MIEELIRALAEERVSVKIRPNIADSNCLEEQDKTTVCGYFVDIDFAEHDKQVIKAYKELMLKRKKTDIGKIGVNLADETLRKLGEQLYSEDVRVSANIDELKDYDQCGLPVVYSESVVCVDVDFSRHDKRVIEECLKKQRG